jgi:hypothetical protein
MDYTWTQANTIKINSNATTDLGIKYAQLFVSPITVTGMVSSPTGEPKAGRFMKYKRNLALPMAMITI